MNTPSFKDIAVVACGTLRMELTALKDQGFLDTEHLLFTTPGLHQDPTELERQLTALVRKGKEQAKAVIVVYGGKFCYVNVNEPLRTMQTVIDELGPDVFRIEATHCMDMIADETERETIAQDMVGGEKVFWMTPGWVRYRPLVFKGWDKGLANENFPRHTGGVIVLDTLGYLDRYMEEHPEDFLEYCDWMGVPMQASSRPPDRLKALLYEQLKRWEKSRVASPEK
ncbi:hypothetical protein JCM14469_30540 [Desulfatiferula olefinivorans]